MVDVQESYSRLKEAGGEVLVVTMGTPELTAVFRTKLDLQFVLLADARREAYQAYGLERGAPSQVIGPRTWLPLLKATFRAGAGKPVGDVRQMPGAFVIDRQGIVRYAYYPRRQTDRPSSDELVTVLNSLA